MFITGVCSISLDSMTSGFNNSTNITTNPIFNSMTALTHDEVKKLINDFDIENKNVVFNEMLEYYDGYNFSEDMPEKVFNPTLTMYYLSSITKYGYKPKNLLDKNIISSYEQIKNIISLGDYKEILDDIFDNGEIESELKTNFDLKEPFDRNDVISLLFYFGYLTIKEANEYLGYKYTIPNKVIRTVFSNYFVSILKEYNINQIDELENKVIKEICEEGNVSKLCEYISIMLKKADNRLYINFKEKDLQIMMYVILNRYIEINSELEYKSNDNYIDMIIFKNEYCKYNIMIELKYIKAKDKNTYNEVRKEAIEQIRKYSLADTLKYVVIFTGSEYTIDTINN